MEPIMFFLLSVSIIGIVIFLGLSQFKVEHHVTNHFNRSNQNFESFLTKIRVNLSKVRR